MQLQKMSEQAERDGEMDDEATMRMMNKGLNFLWIMGKMSVDSLLLSYPALTNFSLLDWKNPAWCLSDALGYDRQETKEKGGHCPI